MHDGVDAQPDEHLVTGQKLTGTTGGVLAASGWPPRGIQAVTGAGDVPMTFLEGDWGPGMTEGEWRWLAVAVSALVGFGIVAFMGHKTDWTRDTRWRERLAYYALLTLAGGGFGWLWSYIVVPLAALGVVELVPGGFLLGLFILGFTVLLPFTVLIRIYIWTYEPFYWKTVTKRIEARVSAEDALYRARMGLPPNRRPSPDR
jgi:hypothetical protein